MAAWSEDVAKAGYDNKITNRNWKTIAIDLSKLKNVTGNGSSTLGSVDLSKIDSIFTSGKTGYKSDASNVEKATTDVIRINNETNSLDYWFDVADDDSNIVRDMNGTTGWGTGKNSPGLFPFNKSSDSSDVNKLNYGFGAKIEIPFTLTEDGKVYPQNSQNEADKVPMKFYF